MRRPTRPRTWQVLRAQEDARVYAELQSKQRAAYDDDRRGGSRGRWQGGRLCSEPRSRSRPAGRHASALSSEGALRCLASSVACATQFVA